MSTHKKRSKVTINNKNYIVIGTKSTEHVLAAAKLVDSQLQILKKSSETLSTEDCSILLALNTVSKQIELEQEILQLRKKINQQEKILSTIHLETIETIESSVEKEQISLFDALDKPYVPAIHGKKENHLFQSKNNLKENT